MDTISRAVRVRSHFFRLKTLVVERGNIERKKSFHMKKITVSNIAGLIIGLGFLYAFILPMGFDWFFRLYFGYALSAPPASAPEVAFATAMQLFLGATGIGAILIGFVLRRLTSNDPK